MTGYDYMMRIRRIELRIKRINLQIEELESCLLPQGIRYDKDKVQTSGADDMLSKVAARILVLEKLRDDLVHDRVMILLEITDALDQLDSEPEKVVLEAYFLSRMSMNDIAELIGYSIRQTYRFRTSGIQHLKVGMNGRMKCDMV